jgi:nitronate monooxygenase
MKPLEEDAWLGLRAPIVLAPMAGGTSTPELAAAVSEAGGLGTLGLAYQSPSQIRKTIQAAQQLTKRPFAVNLVSPFADQPLSGKVREITGFISRCHDRFGLPPATVPSQAGPNFQEQIAAVIDSGVRIFSFTFGLLPGEVMVALHAHGFYVIGTATTVQEALLLEESGADAIIAQGSEAGGHRGTFALPVQQSLIGSMALIPQIVDAVRVPVIASGGIMDGRGIAAALALGATGVQMGTAFLTCKESGAAQIYKERVLAAAESGTILTRAFSGRWARGLSNDFVREFEGAFDEPLSYPWQNAVTRELRRAAAKKQDAEFLSLWAGQGVRMARALSAGDLFRQLVQELDQAKQRLQ